MALGFRPCFLEYSIASGINTGFILNVSGQISTNIGVAPTSFITSAVAIKVNGVVITASPGPIPCAISDIKRASVPDEHVMQC